MPTKFTKLSSILLITIAMSITTSEARAEKVKADKGIRVKDIFENAYYENAGSAFKNNSFLEQINPIFGFKGYPDRQILSDGEALDKVFRKFETKQSRVGHPIKTRDLKNPYTTSLRENPSYAGF